MKKICMVTYMRNGEIFTEGLKEIADALYDVFQESFKVIICCEDGLGALMDTLYDIQVIRTSGTKYQRLINVMKEDNSSYYISIDNDIKGNMPNIIKFINASIDGGYDIGWGKIEAVDRYGVIPQLVFVDKCLSHDIIRPLLWNLNIGISVPGQFFFLKAASFRGKLMKIDTYLDDLAIGLYSSNTSKRTMISHLVLGYELPNTSFKGLWLQRIRWAKGYATILSNIKERVSLLKILTHGFFYHFFWILQWLVVFFSFQISSILGILYLLVTSYIISGYNKKKVGYGILYQMLFPVFHVCWYLQLIEELVKMRCYRV
ncbi:MAG: hypothetical protein ACTTJH_08095 [Bacteroidales bacterium]